MKSTMKPKRLLAILSRYLWPVDGGRKESLNHYFKELHDTYGYEIKLMCFLEYGQKVDQTDVPEYILDVTALQDVPAAEKIKNVLTNTLGSLQWPFQCSFYYSKANDSAIKTLVKEWKPDVIFTEMIRTCVYYQAFANSGALLLSNLDDLLSVRYQKQAKSGKSRASVAGSYSNKLPKPLVWLLKEGPLKNQFLRMESKRCAKWEQEYYKLFDYTLMTSDVERDALNKAMASDKAKTLSVGIDYEYYSQNIGAEKDPTGLSFLGNFNVAANADTLEMIIQEVLPHIQSEFHFYIIGKCPDKLRAKYQDDGRLIFCGRVDDLREYVKKTAVFLAPIAYGTGIKTKIVEAMAMNMPVVTNSVGAEGIHGEAGKDYIVSDDPFQIAANVDKLLNHPELAAKMGEQAGRFAYEHFRWSQVLAVYKQLGV